MTIDSAAVKGPEITVPRDTAEHVLRITAPGYVAHEEKLEYGESQKLGLEREWRESGEESAPT